MSTTQIITKKRENIDKTSMSIDHFLWKRIRHTAIELNISATDFVEKACREKIEKLQQSKD
jgi:hypothetical protein